MPALVLFCLFTCPQLYASEQPHLFTFGPIHPLVDLLGIALTIAIGFFLYRREKRAKEALEFERMLFSTGPVMVIEWEPTPTWPIRYISSNVTEVLGYSVAQMLSPSFVYAKLIHPEDHERVAKEVNHAMHANLDSFSQSYRLKLNNGSYRWFYDVTRFSKDAQGKILSIRGYMFDQTHLKETESELIRQKNRLEYIIEGTNVGTWEWNIQTGETTFDEKWAQMLGYSLDELQPISIHTWSLLSHPQDAQKSIELLKQHFAKETPYYTCESRMRHKKGHWVWVLDRGKVSAWDASGQPLRMSGTHQDITAQKEAQEALRENDLLLKKISEQVPGMIYIFQYDTLGRASFPFASEHIWDVYELRPEDVRYDIFEVLKRIYPEDKTWTLKSIQASFETLSPWNVDYRVILPSKGLRWLRGRANPQKQEDGRVLWYGYIYDATEQIEAQEALHVSTQKANAANEAKGQFLANMSHEIRTPMNAILGLSELLFDTPLTPKQREWLSNIHTSSKILLGIINDILDYSKIDAGKLVLERHIVAIEQIVGQMEAMFQTLAGQKGINFTITTQGEITHFWGDELRLTQVLANLINNAIKFTAQGHVSVSLSTTRTALDEGELHVSITDSGIGISAQQQSTLFQPFTQADSSTTRQFGGTGLGLVISQKIVQAMGGKIEVESQEYQGSRFYFTLPITLPDAITLEKERNTTRTPIPTPSIDLSDLHILLVEDNTLNQAVAKQLLERVGATVSVASDGLEGVQLFLTTPEAFDLILMDLQMPVMSGFDAARAIREQNPTIPILALSAATGQEESSKILEAGMNGFLSKPINSQALYAHILSHTSAHTIGVNIPEPSPSTAIKEVLDETHLRTLAPNDTLFESLIRQLYTHAKEAREQMPDLLLHEPAEAKKALHTLKGVSGNMGAGEVYHLCCDLKKQLSTHQELDPIHVTALTEALDRLVAHSEQILEHLPCAIEPSTLTQEALHSALAALETELNEKNMIDLTHIATLAHALHVNAYPKESIAAWHHALENLDYTHALEIMQTWKP